MRRGSNPQLGVKNMIPERFRHASPPILPISALSLCQVEEPADLCALCESNADCGDGLVCLPCSFDCTNDGRRCVAMDDLGGCEDGVY